MASTKWPWVPFATQVCCAVKLEGCGAAAACVPILVSSTIKSTLETPALLFEALTAKVIVEPSAMVLLFSGAMKITAAACATAVGSAFPPMGGAQDSEAMHNIATAMGKRALLARPGMTTLHNQKSNRLTKSHRRAKIYQIQAIIATSTDIMADTRRVIVRRVQGSPPNASLPYRGHFSFPSLAWRRGLV